MTCASTCLPLFDAHSVIAAARNNQTTEPVASVEEKLAAKDDELKLLQAKVKHRNQKNMTLSLQVTKLKLDIADFTVKVRELEQLYAQTSYEAVRAKKEETSSVLPILGKCKRN
jgi:septal ring factor EnvC (AmiA/AmiB activator)